MIGCFLPIIVGNGPRHVGETKQRRPVEPGRTVSNAKRANGTVAGKWDFQGRGASKIARDITEQRRSQEQIATLAREAEHRSKNLLATVQATVHISQSETPEGLKRAIEGRIQALANVHSLFV